MVAVSAFEVAMRAFALNIAVGKEFLSLLIIILFALHLHKLAVVVEFAEEVACHIVVNLRCGARIDVKRDTELLKRSLDEVVITVNHVLRGATLFLGAYCYRHTMLVAAANHLHILTFEAKITHIDIGRHIHTSQVADMHRTIGIRQRCGYECPFEFFLHIIIVLIF